MWLARFLEALPALVKTYPTARFLFLTLTRRNVPVEDLRESLAQMNKGWERLRKKKAFGVVSGWVRTTEVTRGADNSAHPHFHVLLMVPSNYFSGRGYVTQAAWSELWRDAIRADYQPMVDVRAVKGEAGLIGGVRETLKYAVKPSDMVADYGWFKEMTRQLHKLRFIAAGGVLKNVLRPEQETEDDLMLFGDESEKGEEPSVFFHWSKPVKKYKRKS
jgi:plasmid rolling circle replication initiator protein Rep